MIADQKKRREISAFLFDKNKVNIKINKIKKIFKKSKKFVNRIKIHRVIGSCSNTKLR